MEELSVDQINSFINNGFIKVENAFPTEIADECRAILWKATGCDPDNPDTWTQPVIRIGELDDKPFKKAANTSILITAIDQLVGKGNWHPRHSLGTFPIRFPHKDQANDTGWHVDSSFPDEHARSYSDWRINVYSKGRGLLMLFLFSDTLEQDAPTVIKIGSHLDVAMVLEPEGSKGLAFMELAQKLDGLPHREIAMATGKAGTVYLCHPFIVHKAQDHHGTRPKFMAQPTLLPIHDFNISQTGKEHCPIEIAIIKGLQG